MNDASKLSKYVVETYIHYFSIFGTLFLNCRMLTYLIYTEIGTYLHFIRRHIRVTSTILFFSAGSLIVNTFNTKKF